MSCRVFMDMAHGQNYPKVMKLKCQHCGGTGEILVHSITPRKCPRCRGSGKIFIDTSPDIRVARHRKTKQLFVLEWDGHWVKYPCADMTEVITKVKQLQRNAVNRERRKVAANTAGTSYRAAKEDGGL
jgi:DnaJ-class molecular chaperone